LKYGHEQNYFMTKGSTCILYKYHDNEVHIFKLKYGEKVQNLELKYGQKLHMCTSLRKSTKLRIEIWSYTKLVYGKRIHTCTSLGKVQNLELKYGHTQNWYMA